MNHLGPPGPLGFCLCRDSANHAFVQIDVLDLDVTDLDAPIIRLPVENELNISVQLVPLG